MKESAWLRLYVGAFCDSVLSRDNYTFTMKKRGLHCFNQFYSYNIDILLNTKIHACSIKTVQIWYRHMHTYMYCMGSS